MAEMAGPPGMLIISSGTDSSRPLSSNFQTAGVAWMSLVLKMPLPETTITVRVSKGSNSMLVAQCMKLPAIQLTPFGSMRTPWSTTLFQLLPPSSVSKNWSPIAWGWR